jgi:hypothetical protein
MTLRELLFGKPLRSDAEPQERIGPAEGIPLLGLDALASASYGPEAALTILLVAGDAGSRWIVPVSLCLIGLLLIVYVSYRQTIGAYPNGGGSFTVAHENLGELAGLVAASALAVDYAAASHAPAVSGRPCAAHPDQYAWRPLGRPGVHGARVSVRPDTRRHDRDWIGPAILRRVR